MRLDYVAEIKMVDNYLPGFEMEEQIRTAPEKKIDEQIRAVCGDIASRKREKYRVSVAQKASMAMIYQTM